MACLFVSELGNKTAEGLRPPYSKASRMSCEKSVDGRNRENPITELTQANDLTNTSNSKH